MSALDRREVVARFDAAAFESDGGLFSEPFDPTRPTVTPAGAPLDLSPLLLALARSLQTLEAGGFAVDSTLGAAQFTERSGERVPLHGGTNAEGVTNVVEWSDANTSTEPAPMRGGPVVPGAALRADGHPVNFGTSFALIVDYTGDGVQASALLTYGQTGVRDAEMFAAQATRFSTKDWRTVAFDEADIVADPATTTLVVRQP